MQRLSLVSKIARAPAAPLLSQAQGMSTQPNVANKPPMLDMINIHDEAEQGFMARVVYKSGRLEFSHFPQLGPRKTDPMDPMPQFDMNSKIFYRPNRSEFAEMLAVTHGKAKKAKITTAYGAKIDLSKSSEGYTLSMDSPSKQGAEEVNRKCELHFNNQYAAALRNFFDFACDKQFGFDKPVEGTDAPQNAVRDRPPFRGNDRNQREQPKKEEKGEVKLDDLDDW